MPALLRWRGLDCSSKAEGMVQGLKGSYFTSFLLVLKISVSAKPEGL